MEPRSSRSSARRCRRIELRGFRGVLNSTTNVILECMESGMAFDDAVREAQRLGVAETDPSNDVDGIDAAVKVVGLVNVLMGGTLAIADVKRTGIRGITGRELASSARERRDLEVNWPSAGERATAQSLPVSPPSALDRTIRCIQFVALRWPSDLKPMFFANCLLPNAIPARRPRLTVCCAIS